MMDEGRIYSLKLHEETYINGVYILRVPGGWIYYCTTANSATSAFVPFNNEFMKRTKEDYQHLRK